MIMKDEEGVFRMKFVLKRTYFADRTEGRLECPSGHIVTTLERPDRNNKVNISCIPEGTYEVHRDTHGRHTWFKVLDVEGRSFIEIHEGYKVSHSAGCILLDLLELQDLMLETRGLPFILEITS
jgi:hypothetical protein